jgi:hypothetical protein
MPLKGGKDCEWKILYIILPCMEVSFFLSFFNCVYIHTGRPAWHKVYMFSSCMSNLRMKYFPLLSIFNRVGKKNVVPQS